MNIEQAVQNLEDIKSKYTWSIGADGALDMAISALRAQNLQPTCNNLATDAISRQAACGYCHEDSDGYVMPLEKNCHAFIRFGMDGWELSLKAKGWNGSAKIKYCPMCGRSLTHE